MKSVKHSECKRNESRPFTTEEFKGQGRGRFHGPVEEQSNDVSG